MMVARWQIDAKFGHKQKVIEALQDWMESIGSQIGWKQDKVRLLTGSVGVAESRVCSEVIVKDLAELNEAWNKLGEIEAHQRWSAELEPYIVSGSHHWEIYRLL